MFEYPSLEIVSRKGGPLYPTVYLHPPRRDELMIYPITFLEEEEENLPPLPLLPSILLISPLLPLPEKRDYSSKLAVRKECDVSKNEVKGDAWLAEKKCGDTERLKEVCFQKIPSPLILLSRV